MRRHFRTVAHCTLPFEDQIDLFRNFYIQGSTRTDLTEHRININLRQFAGIEIVEESSSRRRETRHINFIEYKEYQEMFLAWLTD